MKKLLQANYSVVFIIVLSFMLASCGGSEKKPNKKNEKSMTESASAAPASKLNLNTASGDEFKTIPNVGEKMEHEFKEYRPYTSIRQFRKEIAKYVDKSRVEAYEKYVYVPIDRNESDAETLMQIPGLEQNKAKELIDGRPYQNNEAFLNALGSSVNKQGLAAAKKYLKSE